MEALTQSVLLFCWTGYSAETLSPYFHCGISRSWKYWLAYQRIHSLDDFGVGPATPEDQDEA